MSSPRRTLFGQDALSAPLPFRDGITTDREDREYGCRTRVILWRAKIALAGMCAVLLLVALRAGFLTITSGSELRALAEANRTMTVVTPSPRGTITDRNGVVLAENEPSFQVFAQPSALPPKDPERNEALTRAAALIDRSVDDIAREVEAGKQRDTIRLADDVPYETAVSLTVADIPGIRVESVSRRKYLLQNASSLSHILGYTGAIPEDELANYRQSGYRSVDWAGRTGLERAFESRLRGTYGESIVEVDARGKPRRILESNEPVSGSNVTLAIDARFTAEVEAAMKRLLEPSGRTRAAFVAIDPRDGAVRALISYPSYDNNAFARGIDNTTYQQLVNDPNHPLFARATAGEYPSGSTIKPLFAAAGLAEGVTTPSWAVMSTGGVWLGDRFFPDWKPGGHGYSDLRTAIAWSVNTYFYILGGGNESFKGLGLETLMKYARLGGLGAKTGVDLPNEADGFLPTKEWKQETKGEPWYIGDTYNVSIGQGDILVTPLQMARLSAVFANGGNLVTPHLEEGKQTPSQRIFNEDIVATVKSAMRATVTEGSASRLNALPVASAGKTGTAQWSANKDPHAWYIGFAPYDNPEIAYAIIVEEGGERGLAVSIADAALRAYFATQPKEPLNQ